MQVRGKYRMNGGREAKTKELGQGMLEALEMKHFAGQMGSLRRQNLFNKLSTSSSFLEGWEEAEKLYRQTQEKTEQEAALLKEQISLLKFYKKNAEQPKVCTTSHTSLWVKLSIKRDFGSLGMLEETIGNGVLSFSNQDETSSLKLFDPLIALALRSEGKPPTTGGELIYEVERCVETLKTLHKSFIRQYKDCDCWPEYKRNVGVRGEYEAQVASYEKILNLLRQHPDARASTILEVYKCGQLNEYGFQVKLPYEEALKELNVKDEEV